MAQPQKLTNEQKSRLDDFVDSYKQASRKERKGVIKNALTALFPAVPEDDKDGRRLWKEQVDSMKKVVGYYLANHGRRTKKARNPGRAWSLGQVVGKLHKEEVEALCVQESGKPSGATGFFAVYQKVLSKYVKALPKEDQEKYRQMAKEWTAKSPPEAVQQQLAEKHANQYVKEFAQKMWTRLGMRVFVLTAQKLKNGAIDISDYDFNEDLQGKPFNEVRPRWTEKPILNEWARFAEDAFGGDVDESNSEDDARHKRKKPAAVQLDIRDDGRPLLPDTVIDESLGFDDLHPIVREYMTVNYRLDSGHEKAVIPWGAIGAQQQEFIEDQYLPFGFEVQKDPSKMSKTQIQKLLQYWYKRQDNPRVPAAFQFKAYKDRSTGDIVKCDRKGKGRAVENNTSSRDKTSRGRAKKNRPTDVDSGTHKDDSDADDTDTDDSDTDSDSDPPTNRSKPKPKGHRDNSINKQKHKAAKEANKVVKATKGNTGKKTMDEKSSNPSDNDSNTDSDRDPRGSSEGKADSGRKSESKATHDARKKRMVEFRKKALEMAKKKRADIDDGSDLEDDAGVGTTRGRKRKADDEDDGTPHVEARGSAKKSKGQNVGTSLQRKIATRSRVKFETEELQQISDEEELPKKRRSERLNK